MYHNSEKKYDFRGRISKVSPDGRSAIVRLYSKAGGKTRVVISHETQGRIELMNGKGCLVEDTIVSGSAIQGPDSLRAMSVSRDN